MDGFALTPSSDRITTRPPPIGRPTPATARRATRNPTGRDQAGMRPGLAEPLLSVLTRQIADEVAAGRALLRPVWAAEARRRGATLRELAGLLAATRGPGRGNPVLNRIELALAADLAAVWRGLAAQPEQAVAPCAAVLRGVVANLAALFEDVAGLDLGTDIARIDLPGYQRRALVLAAGELVTHALLRGARSRRPGQLVVSLGMIDRAEARLIVADDLPPESLAGPDAARGGPCDLAELLEGTLAWPRHGWAATVAEIRFPVRP